MTQEECEAVMTRRQHTRDANETNSLPTITETQNSPSSASTQPSSSMNTPTPMLTPTPHVAPGSALYTMLSSNSCAQVSQADDSSTLTGGDSIVINGHMYTTNNVMYKIQNATIPYGALVDSGTNGGMAGADIRVLT